MRSAIFSVSDRSRCIVVLRFGIKSGTACITEALMQGSSARFTWQLGRKWYFDIKNSVLNFLLLLHVLVQHVYMCRQLRISKELSR